VIKVELVDSMGSDITVANVARVSFNKWKDEFNAKDEGLIKFLAKHEHTTPFRHPQIMLRCTAPLYVARQLGKHQVGMSWNEVSRRYVDEEPTFHTEKLLRKRPEGGIKQGSSDECIPEHHLCVYNEFGGAGTSPNEYVELGLKLYNKMLERGVAPEVARTFLPQNMDTTWIWTGSLYSFFHVWRLRSDAHAQVEAQQFAKELETVVEKLFPVSWAALKENKDV
jgi:thymidylate synthase (FAD)